MDPDAFSASLFKWDPRGSLPPPNRLLDAVVPPPPPPVAAYSVRPRELGGLEELFQAYGIRYFTAAKIAELGFTVNTLLDMRDEELDEMMNSLSQIFRWDLLVGERYGIKAAVRAERRRLDEEEARRRNLLSGDTTHALDALSQEGLSEEPCSRKRRRRGAAVEGVGDGDGGVRKQRRRKNCKGRSRMTSMDQDDDATMMMKLREVTMMTIRGAGGGNERQREHPFIVTEPGEVARGKKNGLDYLFHLYEQCRDKPSVQVRKEGRCQLHQQAENAALRPLLRVALPGRGDLQRAEKGFQGAWRERRAWRQACYKPLVAWQPDRDGTSMPSLMLIPASASGMSPPSFGSSATPRGAVLLSPPPAQSPVVGLIICPSESTCDL
ncbi:hypothetical protein DH2020_018797 [Rehmannia glutinosa]|uniref:Floricaula/leafy-like transcription factor n=1 Tax=Rehmannia glutinosa TaxID=99300 RepID=A0ABR0WPE6_REHGL